MCAIVLSVHIAQCGVLGLHLALHSLHFHNTQFAFKSCGVVIYCLQFTVVQCVLVCSYCEWEILFMYAVCTYVCKCALHCIV